MLSESISKKKNMEITYRAISFRCRMPFLAPPDWSSELAVTKSIFDMILIHGISRLTIADIADSTPLVQTRSVISGAMK